MIDILVRIGLKLFVELFNIRLDCSPNKWYQNFRCPNNFFMVLKDMDFIVVFIQTSGREYHKHGGEGTDFNKKVS